MLKPCITSLKFTFVFIYGDLLNPSLERFFMKLDQNKKDFLIMICRHPVAHIFFSLWVVIHSVWALNVISYYWALNEISYHYLDLLCLLLRIGLIAQRDTPQNTYSIDLKSLQQGLEVFLIKSILWTIVLICCLQNYSSCSPGGIICPVVSLSQVEQMTFL